MVLVAAAAAGLVIGWARGGGVGGLAQLRLRAFPLLVVAVALALAGRAPWGIPAAPRILEAAGYLFALGMLWANRDRPWLVVLLAGAALNAAVILANAGRMPVSPDALRTAGHPLGGALLLGADPRYVLAGRGTALGVLGDVWPLRVFGGGTIASPGDIVMAVGVAGFVQAGMLGHPPRDT